MIGRVTVLAGGLAGAATLSQFPEFSQQYVQRLGGAVDELSRMISDFDADAAREEMSRSEALVDLAQGGQMGARRAATMTTTIYRYERLSSDLAALQSRDPIQRALLADKLMDREIAARAWENYRPALPLTAEGGIFAAVGFGVAALALALVIGLWRGVFGRRGRRVRA